jgi:hypothetical protein
LQFLEEWAATLPRAAGVSVVQALIYDLVQMLNRAYIEEAMQ